MTPTLREVACLLRSAKSQDYRDLGAELEEWLDNDWPNTLIQVGAVAYNARQWAKIEGQVATLTHIQRQLDALGPADLRQRLRLQTTLLSTVRSLTDALDSDGS